MNLEDQSVWGKNQVIVNDSLNASLIEFTLQLNNETKIPDSRRLIIYVDKQPKETPSYERKEYVIDINTKLRYYNGISDQYTQSLKVINNEIVLKDIVTKRLFYDEEYDEYSILFDDEIYEYDSFPITLFEGINYIYTNYENADINLIYPKDTEFNRLYFNGAMYYQHLLKGEGIDLTYQNDYYKDSFTVDGDKIDLEVNKANVGSLSSINNKFQLDEEGNLIVNTLSCNKINYDSSGSYDKKSICDLIYPIGSIYISVNDITPETLFVGKWERIKDKFLLASGDTFNNGTVGGEINHILSQSELPSHTHLVTGTTGDSGAHMHRVVGTASTNGAHSHPIGADLDAQYTTSGTKSNSLHGKGTSGASKTINTGSSGDHTHAISGNTDNSVNHTHTISITSSSIGNGVAHNNMPPYLAVYIWKRVE